MVKRRVFGSISLLTVLLVSCSSPPEQVSEPILRPVKYQKVFASGGSHVRTFSGAAKAGLESKISFRVAGTIRRLAVEVGDRVSPGELIAELDPTDYQLNIQVAEASLKQAEAQLINAEANLERVRNLYENDNASQSEYDTARAARDSARATVDSVQRQLELLQQQLSYTRLTSPIAGAISEVQVEVNENVSAGRTVVVLTSGSRPEVEVAVPEQLIAQIQKGSRVTVSFDALPGADETRQEFAAEVTEVGVAAGGFATTFPVTVRLRRQESRVLPGMAAEVAFRFAGNNEKDHFWVPPNGVGEDQQGRFVYVIAEQEGEIGTVERRTVRVEEGIGPQGIAILEGLTDGDLVVTAGVSQIQDGMKVKVLGPRD